MYQAHTPRPYSFLFNAAALWSKCSHSLHSKKRGDWSSGRLRAFLKATGPGSEELGHGSREPDSRPQACSFSLSSISKQLVCKHGFLANSEQVRRTGSCTNSFTSISTLKPRSTLGTTALLSLAGKESEGSEGQAHHSRFQHWSVVELKPQVCLFQDQALTSVLYC